MWSTIKKWSDKAAQYAGFYDQNSEPKINVEGAVQIINASGGIVNSVDLDGSFYIGKTATATKEDITVAYASATTLTLSLYPTGITGISATDIEWVRHIDDTTGAVIATYYRASTPMSITANVLTVTGAAFTAGDFFVIQTNIPRSSTGGAGGVGGGTSIYSNMQGDFVAVANNATKTITITGLSFTLEAMHVVHGQIKKITTTGVVTTLNLEGVVVAAGVITLANADDFVTTDTVACIFIGPDKAYDPGQDTTKNITQNPEYAHTTSVETVISETNLSTILATADAGGDADTIVDADGAFTVASTAVGYIGYQTTDSQSATINSVASTTTVETSTLTGGATWASKAYSLPKVMRYEIDMETFAFHTLHWRLTTVANQTVYLKMYGTLDATATADADTNWVDLSASYFGAAAGIICTGAATVEGMKILDTPTTMLKYMLKLVVEKTTAGAPSGSLFTVFIKKSS